MPFTEWDLEGTVQVGRTQGTGMCKTLESKWLESKVKTCRRLRRMHRTPGVRNLSGTSLRPESCHTPRHSGGRVVGHGDRTLTHRTQQSEDVRLKEPTLPQAPTCRRSRKGEFGSEEPGLGLGPSGVTEQDPC